MKSTFLTSEDLKALTGVSRKAFQVKWLQDNGWNHELDYYGSPVVLREYAERRLGLTKTNSRKREPNFAAIPKAS